MALPTVTLTGTVANPDGTPLAGALLWLRLIAPMLDENDAVLVAPTTIDIKLDSDGSFSTPIVPSDGAGLTPTPVAYEVRELFGESRHYFVVVPSTPSSVDLFRDLAPIVNPPDAPGVYALKSDLLTETETRAAADTANTAAITAEASTRASVDAGLATSVTSAVATASADATTKANAAQAAAIAAAASDATTKAAGAVTTSEGYTDTAFGKSQNRVTAAYANTTGTVALNNVAPLAAAHLITMSHALTTLTLPTPTAGSLFTEVRVDFIQDATGGWAVTDPANTFWDGGNRLAFDYAANHVTSVRYTTYDGGTTWRARLLYRTTQQETSTYIVGTSITSGTNVVMVTDPKSIDPASISVGDCYEVAVDGRSDTDASGGVAQTVSLQINGISAAGTKTICAVSTAGLTGRVWNVKFRIYVTATGSSGQVTVNEEGLSISAAAAPSLLTPAMTPTTINTTTGLTYSVVGSVAAGGTIHTLYVDRVTRRKIGV